MQVFGIMALNRTNDVARTLHYTAIRYAPRCVGSELESASKRDASGSSGSVAAASGNTVAAPGQAAGQTPGQDTDHEPVLEHRRKQRLFLFGSE